VVRAYAGLSDPGIDHAPLRRRVFVIGSRQVRDDVDDSTRHLALHAVSRFDASPAADAAWHYKFIFGFNEDGHDNAC